VLIDDGPEANGMRYCCYCGRPLIEVGFVDPLDQVRIDAALGSESDPKRG
jgi:hypothetical protein